MIDRNLELLAPLGIERPNVRFDLEVPPAAAASARKMLQTVGLVDRFAVINPGAGWPSKIWPAERYAAVARHVGEARSAIAGRVGRRRRARLGRADRGRRRTAGPRKSPPTSLCELAAILRQATLFVGSDTGPLHLAAAVGTPCVGLFGPMPAERNGPYGAMHIAVQEMCLSGTSRQRRTAGPESMEAIGVEQVAMACDQILDRAARPAA